MDVISGRYEGYGRYPVILWTLFQDVMRAMDVTPSENVISAVADMQQAYGALWGVPLCMENLLAFGVK